MGHWTLDNAENNVTFMKALEKGLDTPRDIPFCHKNNRIRCFPHIINLCTQRVIESFNSDGEQSNGEQSDDAAGHKRDKPHKLLNPIAKCRSFVRAVRASGARRDRFNNAIKLGNELKTFQLPELQLLQDCKTRWDSTYQMISRLRQLQPVSTLTFFYIYFHLTPVGR